MQSSASASSSYLKEIEELEKKMLSGKDFLINNLSENQLNALCKDFSKYMITSSLELATYEQG